MRVLPSLSGVGSTATRMPSRPHLPPVRNPLLPKANSSVFVSPCLRRTTWSMSRGSASPLRALDTHRRRPHATAVNTRMFIGLLSYVALSLRERKAAVSPCGNSVTSSDACAFLSRSERATSDGEKLGEKVSQGTGDRHVDPILAHEDTHDSIVKVDEGLHGGAVVRGAEAVGRADRRLRGRTPFLDALLEGVDQLRARQSACELRLAQDSPRALGIAFVRAGLGIEHEDVDARGLSENGAGVFEHALARRIVPAGSADRGDVPEADAAVGAASGQGLAVAAQGHGVDRRAAVAVDAGADLTPAHVPQDRSLRRVACRQRLAVRTEADAMDVALVAAELGDDLAGGDVPDIDDVVRARRGQ